MEKTMDSFPELHFSLKLTSGIELVGFQVDFSVGKIRIRSNEKQS